MVVVLLQIYHCRPLSIIKLQKKSRVVLLYSEAFKSVIFESVIIKKNSEKCWDDPIIISHEDLKITLLLYSVSNSVKLNLFG